ncbi:MAG: FAD-dependent oxidoreductase [Gemmataceae bacterium]
MPDNTQRTSVWVATAKVPEYPAIAKDEKADVCVVGAGIAGLSTAYLLAREGKRVVVIDDGRIGSGQTERTTAHLANAIDDRFYEIERVHGEEGAHLAAESHTAAIDRIEMNVRDEKIDCDFTRLDGYLFLMEGEDPDKLQLELKAANRAGLHDVKRLPKVPVDFYDFGPCLRFPRQGQFHPLKYLAGLAEATTRMGGKIFCNTHVTSIQGGMPAQITAQNGPVVTADAVVVATNTPVNDRVAIHTKQAPYISYVVGAAVPPGSIPKALYWDTGITESDIVPYHYVRLDSSAAAEILIIGGEDHKTGQADDAAERHGRLERWARERFPMIQDIAFRWSGQVMETVDGVAFIGRNPMDSENVFIATGDSGMGMTHGTIAGILLTDLIVGRENHWESLYSPRRKSLRSIGEFTKENLNVAKQYGDWLTGGDVSSDAEIGRNSGGVIRRGLHKVAVYRDEAGTLHEFSATCPHLGCIVQWNPSEKSWDCPCHGSRFDSCGKVVNGPANRNLTPLAVHEEQHA